MFLCFFCHFMPFFVFFFTFRLEFAAHRLYIKELCIQLKQNH